MQSHNHLSGRVWLRMMVVISPWVGRDLGGWGTLLCSFPSIFKVGFWGLVGFPKILEHIFKVHLSSLGVQSEILHAILLLTYNEANYDHYQQ